ncbi:hypothetical protein SLEP1_g41054 [Rubroshorea leprosula]|uniref:Reverse transcriptase domain-containing protein n=1 Tax=Rubroshorea leprosula TaxID=152421 RepID=A0AAV5L5X1_9ROSI|nr:hypothetical protein SLEP1_g41054 [Rubroshorea leprosula]
MKKGKVEFRVAQNRREEKQWVRRDGRVRPGRSYAQAVAVSPGAVADVIPEKTTEKMSVPLITEGVAGATSPIQGNLVLEFLPSDEEVAWLNRSMVAMVRSLHMIILIDNSEGCLVEFIENNKELTELWFEWVQPTSLSTVSAASRLAWLRFFGVPLHSWSERCFAELEGLIGEVILVDEDTKSKSFLCEGWVLIMCEKRAKISATIHLKVGNEAFPIEVAEEEWRMDPDWWLAGEQRNLMSESVSEYFSDDGSESGLMASGFCGEDEAMNGDIQAVTDAATEGESFKNFELIGMEMCGLDGADLVGLARDDLIGPKGVDMVGPAATRSGEQQAVGGGWEEKIKSRGGELGNCKNKMQKGSKKQGQPRGTQAGAADGKLLSVRWVGLGSVVKRKEISKLVRKENPNFLFIQETKLEQIDMSVCRLVWNSDDFEWVMQKSNGNSGGMLCIWNKRYFVKQRVVEGQGFIGISGEWGQQRIQCTFVNVYALCNRQRRVVLWGELRRLVLDEGGRWLLAGDFNAVRNSAERKGRMGETQDMEEFNLFVQETGLVDIRLRNRKFTWYRPDGTSMSRLDRFLLSTKMSLMEGDWIQEGIRRMGSLQVQAEVEIEEECKRWNDRVFGNVEARFDKLRNEIERLDKKCEVEGLNEAEVKQRREAFQELRETLKQRELVWKQKSRANWASFGDANIAFFHRSVHARRAQNTISGIYGDNGWVEEPELVKAEAVKYFTKEIEEGLNDCDGSKAPGPNGFNFNFVKFAWSTMKEDFVNFVTEFHRNGRPISLIGCLYKLLAKVLANRLKMVMEGIISESQAAFIGGRQLVDSVLVLNEVVHEVKWRKQECFILKADFEKAYDYVDWGFLDWMMNRMGFGFADDTVFMGKADVDNLRVVKAILNWFQLISGLKINFGKSYLYGFNVSEGWVKGAVDILRCGVGKMPFTYLGLPVGGNSGRRQFWNPVLDRFRQKLASWKSPLLSFGGDGVDGLWKRVLWEKYYGGRKEADVTSVVTWNMSGVWKDIVGLGRGSEQLEAMLGKGFKWKVGNGSCVDFWHDKWVGDKSLRNLFPRLYALANIREGLLKDMGFWSAETWIWDCRLATKDNLCRRGVVVPGGNVCCGLCHEGVEHLQHIFCECKAVWLVWMKVLGWWGVQSPLPKDVFGLADVVVAGINGGCWTEVGTLVFLVTTWHKAAVFPIQIGFYARRSARGP